MATGSHPRWMTAKELLNADVGEGSQEPIRETVVASTPPPGRDHAFVCNDLADVLAGDGRRTGSGSCFSLDAAASPSNRPRERDEKVAERLEAGGALAVPIVRNDDDVVENVSKLPGFRSPVSDLFS